MLSKVKRLRPESLGIIIATGGLDLYSVHCGTYVDKYMDGREQLEVLATTAILSRMWHFLVAAPVDIHEADIYWDSLQERARKK